MTKTQEQNQLDKPGKPWTVIKEFGSFKEADSFREKQDSKEFAYKIHRRGDGGRRFAVKKRAIEK